MRVGTVALDAERRIESADAAALKLLGMTEREARGQALSAVVVPDSADDVTAAQGQLPSSSLGLARQTGATLLVNVNQLPGRGLTATLVSVNEYLAESQSLARVKLRNTIESIMAGFAHEVRNPLAAILSLTEAALLEVQPPETPLVRIPGLVARVEALIKQALSYSRPSAPRRELHQATTIVDHVATVVRKRSGKTLEVAPPSPTLPPVMVDLLQGEQVLTNLIDNALDAAKSHVQVSARQVTVGVPAVCIEVLDDGPGIPPETASRMFDPFFTTKAHGTGLGLAIARDLARLNGGDLRYCAVPSGGTAFQLHLPSTAAPVRGTW
ncbi:MAG: hypothetical protein K1X89_10485 [Myxococcaceae bacterium]|nr:hypothetical protein [Myxococcaceae bacterium]